MDYVYALLVGFHTLAAVIWVGGMFFAHMALRPAAAEMAPAERLGLWRRVLPNFFRWVWVAISTLLITGYGALYTYRGGFGGGGLHVEIMQVTGLTMIALFLYLFFAPWQSLQQDLASGDLPRAAIHQGRIRIIVTINLVLGLVTSFLASAGMLLGH